MAKLTAFAAMTFATWIGVVAPVPPERASAIGDGKAPACIAAEKCCKICDAGRACGNSCISAKKQCHKGRGCACNAAEICSP